MDLIKLFEPIKINQCEIPNRIVMPAMGLWYTDKYEFNDRYKAFYRERARGGVGLMIIGPVAVDRVGSAPFMPELFDDGCVQSFREFTGELRATTKARVGTQLFHMGRNAFSAFTGLQPIGPSPIKGSWSPDVPREMTKEDIEEVKASFAAAARRAVEAGFEYIEIIACTGYLLSQFLSPLTNRRSDEYGGELSNRMRFGLEVIEKVRAAVGPGVAVGIRVSGHDFMEGGHTNRESSEFCAHAEKAGVNAINVTGGWHETNIPQLTTDVPPGSYIYLARGIKEKVTVPVFASNRLGDPVVAERALRSGACDMVCWGRPLIADPELPNKARKGRLGEIVPCIACNQGCFDSIVNAASVTCVLNPRAGREEELSARKAKRKKTILVAGGGPAGMEFALTAARRGHSVTLYESEKRLGGQLNLAKAPPRKKELQKIIDSLEARMEREGVKVRKGTALTPAAVKRMKPDAVVVATGARPLEIKVPGIKKPHVVSAWDVLDERVSDIGRNVVVVGGSATGCETAHYIASLGVPDADMFTFLMFHGAESADTAAELLHSSLRKITVIEMTGRIAENVGRSARWGLLKSLRLHGVEFRTGTKLIEITDSTVLVETPGGRESIPADTVVMAVGARPEDGLSKALSRGGIKTVVIGDARGPRKITDAVREGFEEAIRI